MEEKENKTIDKVTEEIDKTLNRLMEQGVQSNNIDFLYKMIDVKKDIAEIKKEEEEMMYKGRRSYRDYGEGRGRNQYGEYNEGSYGRRQRDSRGRYMEGTSYGHEMLDEMYGAYGEYHEGRQEYNRGNYGAKEDTMKSLEYMLESMVDFVEMLKNDASSQEEINLIKKYTKKISEM